MSTLNYEALNVYSCNVTVTDGGLPMLADTAVVTIYLINVNDPPVFVGCPASSPTAPCRTLSVYENSVLSAVVNYSSPLITFDEDGGTVLPSSVCQATHSTTRVRHLLVFLRADVALFADPLTYTLSSSTPLAPFTLSSVAASTIVVSGAVDYESQAVYSLTVFVTDSRSAPVPAYLTLNVIDVNEPPAFPAAVYTQTFKVAATRPICAAPPCCAAHVYHFDPEQVPKASTAGQEVLRINAADPESTHVSYTLVSGSSNASTASGFVLSAATVNTVFSVSSNASLSGQVTVVNGTLFAVFNQYDLIWLIVTATDATGMSATTTLNVSVTAGDFPPVLPSGQYRSVHENAAVGTTLGLPLTASDADSPVLTFDMAATASNPASVLWFAVNATTGQLFVQKAGLDYENPGQ